MQPSIFENFEILNPVVEGKLVCTWSTSLHGVLILTAFAKAHFVFAFCFTCKEEHTAWYRHAIGKHPVFEFKSKRWWFGYFVDH